MADIAPTAPATPAAAAPDAVTGVGPTAVTPPTQDAPPKAKANPADEFIIRPEATTFAPGYDESNVGFVMADRRQPNSAVTPAATDVSIDPNHS